MTRKDKRDKRTRIVVERLRKFKKKTKMSYEELGAGIGVSWITGFRIIKGQVKAPNELTVGAIEAFLDRQKEA